jgi:hypothetical protein
LLDSTKAALTKGQPQYFCPHGGPEGVVHGHVDAMSATARDLVHDVKILVGIGFDTWVQKAVDGVCTVEDAVNELLFGCAVAVSVGAVGVVADAEATSVGSKACPFAAAIATQFIAAVRKHYPGLVVAHTSYDGPARITYHDEAGEHAFGFWGDYPWEEWCADGASDVHVPQVYWAAQAPFTAVTGSGPRRLTEHRLSWQAAQDAKRIGLAAQHAVYVQAHGSTVEDLCTVTDAFTFRAFWAANGDETFDANGLTAFAAMCKLSRFAMSIRGFQAVHGLAIDGLVGPATLRELGVL